MRRILVGYDASDGARRALDRAIDEARAQRGRICVLAVAELPLDPGAPRTFGTIGDIGAWEDRPLEAPPDVLDALTEAAARVREAGVGAELAWAVGEPAQSIVDTAKDVHADVIIIGEHHHGLMGRLFGADVGAEITRQAGCEVELA